MLHGNNDSCAIASFAACLLHTLPADVKGHHDSGKMAMQDTFREEDLAQAQGFDALANAELSRMVLAIA